ncbi:hypothetical protein CYMTET_28136, partial [Cymbomonas tetramitiformis]
DPEDWPMMVDNFMELQHGHLVLSSEHLKMWLLDANAVSSLGTKLDYAFEVLAGREVDADAEALKLSDPLRPFGQRLAECRRLLRLQMRDQLHFLLYSSVRETTEFFESFVQTTCEEDDDEVLDAVYTSLSRNTHNGVSGVAWATALYVLDLEVSTTSSDFIYSPSLDNVASAVRETFQGILDLSFELQDLLCPREDGGAWDLPPLLCLPANDPVIVDARARLEAVLEQSLKGPNSLVQAYQEFQYLLEYASGDYLANWHEAEHTMAEYEEEIRGLRTAAMEIMVRSYDWEVYGLIKVRVRACKDTLLDAANSLADGLLKQVVLTDKLMNEHILEQTEQIMGVLEATSNNAEELAELKRYLAAVYVDLEDIESQVNECKDRMDLLYRFQEALEPEEQDIAWKACACPKRLHIGMTTAQAKVVQDTRHFMEELAKQTTSFATGLANDRQEVEKFKAYYDLENCHQYAEDVAHLRTHLDEAHTTAALINSREQLFGLRQTEYPQLAAMEKLFQPYAMLWEVTSAFQLNLPMWMEKPFNDLERDLVENKMTEWYGNMFKLSKSSVLTTKAVEVAETMHAKIGEFKVNVPLVMALRNPGLRGRHWEAVSALSKTPVKPDEQLTLGMLLGMRLDRFISEIEDISEVASKEYGIEKMLDRMEGEWAGLNLECSEYRDTGTYILKGLDDIQMLLDDQIIKTQTIRGSPFIKPFEDRCQAWEKKLNLLQETLDEWIKCQIAWMYLEPIFGSDDIMQQMPREGRRFRAVDRTWRQVMEETHRSPSLTAVLSIADLLGRLVEANKILEEIHKGLNEYLETKRQAFPRFFFLSNDELLQILSETKDPLRAQPFLKKVFEAIHRLEFQDDLTITAMLSEEKEKVAFQEPVDPKEAQGQVEKWFAEVEKAMRVAVRSEIRIALESYAAGGKENRVEWVMPLSGQVALAATQTMWTQEVTQAILAHQKKGLQRYEEKCTSDLQDVVERVRGEVTSLERKTIGALIVLDVHARDVVKEMADAQVTQVTEFKWTCQLRYYWEERVEMTKGKKETKRSVEMDVRMINASRPYGYEYLGNSSRLVITPLTDRCYRTLMSAIHLNMGGAPEGPAGTGKTETTKDLAKALAMQCVVFNCSDQLDYLAMSKFFKGLAGCGAWACFDEFNRIDLEVLSVIAQQILDIQLAIAAGLKKFQFDGSTCSIIYTCNVFITMNPGYAGRSELPDNLKALFRPVAMMVPNYALISEIILYSCGYLQGRQAAGKIVQTYKLCSEQLSSQDHYDYGMRAVIAVLRAAGNLKQRYPDEDESILILRSIKDVNEPKFLSQDLPLFAGILSDLFPGVELPAADYALLLKAMSNNIQLMQLQPVPVFLSKTIQLYEMILVRHGLMLVGYSYGAKSSSWKVLQKALTELTEKEGGSVTHVTCINPKSITMGQLYGENNAVSMEWNDGVLSNAFRTFADDPDTSTRKWLLLDGPVDAIWIENMNTVLDDNKKLCLTNGEIIQMPNGMNLIFEVQDLAVASPATVSRCGMVYVEPHTIGWEPLIASYMEFKLPASITTSGRARLQSAVDWLVPPSLRLIRKYCEEPVATLEIGLVANLIRLFDATLDEFRPPKPASKPQVAEGKGKPKAEAASAAAPKPAATKISNYEEPRYLDSLFLFSMVWSVGGSTDAEGRKRFNHFFRLLIEGSRPEEDLGPGYTWTPPPYKVALNFPSRGQVYDYVFDKQSLVWASWLDTESPQKIPPTAQFNDIVVSSVDTIRYSYLVDLLLTHESNVLLVGPTGTGKTVYVKRKLASRGGLNPDEYQPILLNFSAQTSANQTQVRPPPPGAIPLLPGVCALLAGIVRCLRCEPPRSEQHRLACPPHASNLCPPSNIAPRVPHPAAALVDKGSLSKPPTLSAAHPAYRTEGHLHGGPLCPADRRRRARLYQELMDSKLDKRRKGVYGPPLGKKCILFVDDVNMPKRETYGAQPPIELLRQYLDYGGWYDLSDQSFRQVKDVQLINAMGPPGGGRNEFPATLPGSPMGPQAAAAMRCPPQFPATLPDSPMGPPGGGRNEVTLRYMRHFNLLSITPFDDESLMRIFGALLEWWMTNCRFKEDITRLRQPLVVATIQVYRAVQEGLLPTPTKSHYTFNLRDVAKVMQGVTSTHDGAIADGVVLTKLWLHESLRIFHDRLISDEDQTMFYQVLRTAIPRHFPDEYKGMFPSAADANKTSGGSPKRRASQLLTKENIQQEQDEMMRHLLFGDFMMTGVYPKPYVEIASLEEVQEVVNQYLADYNSVNKKPMHLVMFRFAIEHVCRVARIIRQPYGNALLVGVGGSGRQSATHLATYINEFDLFQVEVTATYSTMDWHEDLKLVLRKAGEQNKPTTFLITDTQIKYDSFVEDISNIFNTGEVNNLFAIDELSGITEAVRNAAKAAKRETSRSELYQFFVERCRTNLHIVLCISPVGEKLRGYLRMFPSLANCCTIDWYTAWPEDALLGLAERELADVEMDPQIRTEVVSMCKMVHSMVRDDVSKAFFAEQRRQTYVTPMSYLELLGVFKMLLAAKRLEVTTASTRYSVGLNKLLNTADQVGSMSIELEALQPKLIQSSMETDEIMQVIDRETAEANKKKAVVEVEENEAKEKADASRAIKDDCDRELSVAMPILESAIKALNTLNKNDIMEVKGMQNPPKGVKLVMEAVCIMKGIKPTRVKDPNTGRYNQDYWESSKKMLNDVRFLESLENYEKDSIPPATIKAVQPYITNPDFAPDQVKKASKAAHGLSCWVIAIEKYDKVAKVVAPKKLALEEAESKLQMVMASLEVKRAALKEVSDKIAKLNEGLQESKAKKAGLEEEVANCTAKLDRASKLISGLGGEKARWTQVGADLGVLYTNLVGDMVLSAAIIAYMGPYTAKYREECLQLWVSSCRSSEIPCTGETYRLADSLGVLVDIRTWVINGLPSDNLSVDNAVIMQNARRWPLMIDPQGQANKWVKNMGRQAAGDLMILKPVDKNLTRQLESALRDGSSVLLQNGGEVGLWCAASLSWIWGGRRARGAHNGRAAGVRAASPCGRSLGRLQWDGPTSRHMEVRVKARVGHTTAAVATGRGRTTSAGGALLSQT